MWFVFLFSKFLSKKKIENILKDKLLIYSNIRIHLLSLFLSLLLSFQSKYFENFFNVSLDILLFFTLFNFNSFEFSQLTIYLLIRLVVLSPIFYMLQILVQDCMR